MALSGVILFGFVLIHMIGNLKLYMGADKMNEYGHFLRTVGAPAVPEQTLLWVARIVLLAAVVIHIHAAWAVTRMSQASRPVAYSSRKYTRATYASRTMRWGGVIALLFIIYHLLHLTVGIGVAPHEFRSGDPYHNTVAGFRVWWISAFYIIANLALGLHLFHGLWAMFNSLGLNHPKFNAWRWNFATAFALIVTLGNISFPLAVLAGIVR
jgi:succinate dehydrogenase / fumarate reductase cytochrome b subunit